MSHAGGVVAIGSRPAATAPRRDLPPAADLVAAEVAALAAQAEKALALAGRR
jgi:hypothetical protein